MIYDQTLWLKSYDDNVKGDVEVPETSLIDFLDDSINQHLSSPALNFMGMGLNYGELQDWANRFASGLANLGVGKGDVIACAMPNIPQYIISLLGGLKVGCVVSGLSPLFSPEEMAYQLKDSKARVLVTYDVKFEECLPKIADQVPDLKHVLVCNIADFLPLIKRTLGKLLKKVPVGQVNPLPGKTVTGFSQFCKSQSASPPKVKINADDPCFLQYTGGTTGYPKGAVLTNRNIVSVLKQLEEWLKLEYGCERNLAPFPTFHIAGLVVNCLLALRFSGEQTLIPNPRDLAHMIKEWDKLNPTWGVMSPTLFTMLANEPAFHQLDFSSLKWCFSGSAPFSPEAMATVEKLFGPGKIREGLGMTESCAVLAVNPIKGPNKIGSVGLPVTSTHIRIMDLETGTEEMPIGEPGEIIAAGPQILKEYYDRPEETAETLIERDGKTWLYTGDIGYIDEDGYLFVVDRKKDMVIVGGYKVFSTEVEAKFYTHPSVLMCAIVGLPNPQRPGSELVKLVVQKSDNYKDRPNDEVQAELTIFAKEKLAPYKVPKVIEIVDEMPLTGVGKVDKKRIRAN